MPAPDPATVATADEEWPWDAADYPDWEPTPGWTPDEVTA